MLHLGIDAKKRVVNVYALIHTSRNPESTWGSEAWFVSESDYYYAPVRV